MKKIIPRIPLCLILLKKLLRTANQMFVFSLFICLLSVISACERAGELPAIHYVDPQLEVYFDRFRAQALEHGCQDQLEKYCRVICDEIEGLYVGYSDKENHSIVINAEYLQNPKLVDFVMMHECGHYFFNMDHGDNLIMADGLEIEVVRKYVQNRQFYLNEFFESANSQRSGAAFSKNAEADTNNKVKCAVHN